MSIHEVAKRANVSTATVSRTINTPERVDPVTAARVQRAIQDLNYFPDTHARTLVSGKSRILGLLVSDITNPFFPELIKGFGDVAVERGYDILIGSTNYSLARMAMSIRRMLERKVDGLAIMTSERDAALIEQLSHHSIPSAFLDVGPPGSHFFDVEISYSQGIGEAVDHLLSLDHKRFAFIGGPPHLPSAQMRQAAFLGRLRERGIDESSICLTTSDFTIDGGFAAMNEALAHPVRPTAVLGGNDLCAIGALRAVHQAGLRVPTDVSIIGFDDIHLTEFTEPPLTTVRLPRQELATRTVTWLVDAIEEHSPKVQVPPLETHLVLRQSTAEASRRPSAVTA
jgi:LacI family transcriptional regulator